MSRRSAVSPWTFVVGVVILLLMLFITVPARPAQTMLVFFDWQTTETRQIFPKNYFKPAWEYDRRCAGVKPQKGGDYRDVKWFYARHGTMPQGIIGVWLRPDTIVVDSIYLQAPWVIEHELLHHLLQLPEGVDPHPDRPFLFPCMLTTPQNIPAADWRLIEAQKPDGTTAQHSK